MSYEPKFTFSSVFCIDVDVIALQCDSAPATPEDTAPYYGSNHFLAGLYFDFGTSADTEKTHHRLAKTSGILQAVCRKRIKPAPF